MLPFDEKAALIWARLMAEGTAKERPRSPLDMVIAAVAKANDCIVVTENEKDFAGMKIVNPLPLMLTNRSTGLPKHALPQIATTATSRPEALTRRSMSCRSLVRIVALCRTAVVTTTASTTSAVLVMPNSRPDSCASVSPRGTITHPVKKRRSWAWCEERLTWAITGAGTMGTTPSSKRALCSAQARRSFNRTPPSQAIGGDENGGVVDHPVHAGRRTVREVRSCARTVRRASFISSVVRRPCCFSHSATALKPARRCSASRAAAVIQAETLTPSRAAAARMSS